MQSPTPSAQAPTIPMMRRQASLPGGGTKRSMPDQPGDACATLIVLLVDDFISKKAYKAQRPVPAGILAGLETALNVLSERERSVVIFSGGAVWPPLLMQELVLRMPGGLDSFGRGRKIESMVKQTAGQFGNLWDSALLVKMVAKRQASLVRFGSIVVVTTSCCAAPAARVFRKCFEDWHRPRSTGGGQIDVHVESVALEAIDSDAESAAISKRASTLDDAWFARYVHSRALTPAASCGQCDHDSRMDLPCSESRFSGVWRLTAMIRHGQFKLPSPPHLNRAGPPRDQEPMRQSSVCTGGARCGARARGLRQGVGVRRRRADTVYANWTDGIPEITEMPAVSFSASHAPSSPGLWLCGASGIREAQPVGAGMWLSAGERRWGLGPHCRAFIYKRTNSKAKASARSGVLAS